MSNKTEIKEAQTSKKNEDQQDTNSEPKELKVVIPIVDYFKINMVCFCIPITPLVVILLFYPSFMKSINADTLFGLVSNSVLGFADFWIFIFWPLVALLAIAADIYLTIYLGSLYIKKWNKISPPVEGIFHREFSGKDVIDPVIKYYHYRGFVIKWPLWLAYKSPFPWLMIRVLRKIGHNKIDKSVIMMESFPGLEFCTVGKNVIYYPSSMISAHSVDSIFGLLSITAINIGDNTFISPHSIVGPGAEILDNYGLFPNTIAAKNWKGVPGKYYYAGAPARTIDHIYSGVFSVLPEEAAKIYKEKGSVLAEDLNRLTQNAKNVMVR
jgi:hypothetical protein